PATRRTAGDLPERPPGRAAGHCRTASRNGRSAGHRRTGSGAAAETPAVVQCVVEHAVTGRPQVTDDYRSPGGCRSPGGRSDSPGVAAGRGRAGAATVLGGRRGPGVPDAGSGVT